jgi:hypothetical protein
VAGHKGADKLKKGESDDHEGQKEADETPERRVGVSWKGARSVAFVRGGLTTAALGKHCSQIKLRKVMRVRKRPRSCLNAVKN